METGLSANNKRFALPSRCPDESAMLATKRGRFSLDSCPYPFTPSHSFAFRLIHVATLLKWGNSWGRWK